MKIGELSKKSGCSVQTIRYYEKEKLLPSPNRSEGNFRIYNEENLNQLLFIKRCRNLNINLNQIKKLIGLKNCPDSDCSNIKDIIRHNLIEVEQQMRELKALKQELQQLDSQCPSSDKVENCGILKSLL